MKKYNYPKFDITNGVYTACLNPNFCLVLGRAGNWSRKYGFEFNVYTSRPVVMKHERRICNSIMSASDFFDKANKYMGSELLRVLQETVKADPMLLDNNNIKLLK